MHKLKLSLLVLAITGVTAGALFTAYTPSNEGYKPTVKADAPIYSFSFDAGNRLYEGVEASSKGTINKTSTTGGIVSFQYEGISKGEGVFQVLNAGAYIENHFVSDPGYHNRISTITSITYNNASAADLKLYFGEGYEDAVVWKSSSSLESGSHTVTAGAGISFVRIVNETASPINLVSFSINYSCVPPSFTHLANYSEGALAKFSTPSYNYELIVPEEVSGDNITSIAEDACKSHNNLITLKVSNSVVSIGKNAFYDCRNLKEVTLGNSVVSLIASCFNSCKALKTITLPVSVTSIGSFAFGNCEKLTELKYMGTVSQWGSVSKGNTVFPGCLTSITCTNGSVSL